MTRIASTKSKGRRPRNYSDYGYSSMPWEQRVAIMKFERDQSLSRLKLPYKTFAFWLSMALVAAAHVATVLFFWTHADT
jgi:hypothetical protein